MRGVPGEAGVSLVEVLVAVTILGVAVAGITSGLGTASLASDYHRKGVNADTVVRDYAEAIKQHVRRGRYMECATNSATGNDYSPDQVGYTVPSGYTADIAEDGIRYQTSSSLNLILVIDRSGSMYSSRTTVKSAAKAFLDDLKDTAARVAIVSFNNDAQVDAGPQSINQNLTSLKTTIDGLNFPPSAGTNWDAALVETLKVVQGTHPMGRFPLGTAAPHVVMLTDGDPTYYVKADGSLGGNGSATTSTEVTEAVNVANDLKNYYAVHMFALGVHGNGGLNSANLQAISGTKKFPSQEASFAKAFAKADWMEVTNVNDLGPALDEISADLNVESFSDTCPTPDQGAQRLKLVAGSLTDNRASETLEIIVRKP